MSRFPDITDDPLLDEEGPEALDVLASLLADDFEGDGPKSAILASLPKAGRLDRFADAASSLLDIDLDEARRLLDEAGYVASYEPSPFPGVRLYHVTGGPRVADAITGFVRIEGGMAFPDHDHLGEESVLVLQGSCIDMPSGEVYRPGDVVAGRPGVKHSVVARPGPDLVYLAVLAGGLDVDGAIMLPGDPRV